MTGMGTPRETIADVRRIPLARLAATQGAETETLDRITPGPRTGVPVAAFNSAL